MEYTIVFDVSQSGYRQWIFVAFGLLFVIVGFGCVYLKRMFPGRCRRLSGFGCLGFAVFWTLAVLLITCRDYSGLVSALREGRCGVVEGVVSDFHPMPFQGHEMEWFVVGGKRFEYSDYVVTAGFNNTASHGGPIRQGVRVRVHYLGNEIARLEVAR